MIIHGAGKRARALVFAHFPTSGTARLRRMRVFSSKRANPSSLRTRGWGHRLVPSSGRDNPQPQHRESWCSQHAGAEAGTKAAPGVLALGSSPIRLSVCAAQTLPGAHSSEWGNSALGKNGKAQTSQGEGDQQPHQKFSCSAISEQEIASKSSFSPNLSQSHALRPLCRAFPPLFPNACPAQQHVGSAGWHRAAPGPWQTGVKGQKQPPWVAGMGPVPVVPMKPPPDASATKCRVLSAPI